MEKGELTELLTLDDLPKRLKVVDAFDVLAAEKAAAEKSAAEAKRQIEALEAEKRRLQDSNTELFLRVSRNAPPALSDKPKGDFFTNKLRSALNGTN